MTTGRSADSGDSAARTLAEQGVKYCLASYVDLHGIPKG